MDRFLQQALDGEVTLYRTLFPTGHEFVYRALSLKEYRIFRALLSSGQYHEFEIYDLVFERCCKQNIASIAPAGLTISVGRFIMWISGDCETIEQIRSDIEGIRASGVHETLHESMKHWICVAEPTYTVEEMDGWDRSKLLNAFVRAEAILQKKYPSYKPLDTNTIRNANDPVKPAEPIDFKKENRQLMTGLGPHAIEEANELAKKERSKEQARKLTPEQARMLQKRRSR